MDARGRHGRRAVARRNGAGRCVFTFNVRDFTALATVNPRHDGIILAAQRRWALSELIDALDRALATTEAEDLVGQVRWLNEWRLR
jgi:hypothetical protein